MITNVRTRTNCNAMGEVEQAPPPTAISEDALASSILPLRTSRQHCGADGRGHVATHRVLAAIKPGGGVSREEPRQFYLDRCQNVRLARAADFLMPVAMFGKIR